MAALGKSIRIYLADGTPSGIRHAELVNWTGQAIVCPRGRMAELAKWEEAQRPGVYFLVGDADDGVKPAVYIGEAENVVDRLRDHVKRKDFWTKVLFFTSKDDNLTKAHVKYLEARLVAMANEADRSNLENGNAPQLPALPRADRDAMEEFLEPVGVLLGTLGLNVLQRLGGVPQSSTKTDTPSNHRLVYEGWDGAFAAAGTVVDEGFLVAAESKAALAVAPSLRPGNRALRERLKADGNLKEDGKFLIFTKDTLFTSPSAAAAAISGSETNGRQAWKDERGKMLKELEEELSDKGAEK